MRCVTDLIVAKAEREMGHEPPPRPPAEGAPSPDAADEEIVEQEQLPPPPPLAPELAVPPPRVADVRHTTARVEWQAASSSFPDPGSWEDPRQGDVQARCTYSLPQQLQLQEVATSSGDSSSPEDRLREAAAHVVEGDWRTVHEAPCCSAEVRSSAARRARRVVVGHTCPVVRSACLVLGMQRRRRMRVPAVLWRPPACCEAAACPAGHA